jgi:hypothetical protein
MNLTDGMFKKELSSFRILIMNTHLQGLSRCFELQHEIVTFLQHCIIPHWVMKFHILNATYF